MYLILYYITIYIYIHVPVLIMLFINKLQSWILSQDPVGDLTMNKWEDKVFDQSRLIEPKEGPVRTAVSVTTPLVAN